MLINEQTKIAALLKQHPDALETIVTLSPDFKKLRNPILRKLMAGRTSIAMASKIGGCKPEDFFKALAPLGFEIDKTSPTANQQLPENKPMPDYLKTMKPEQILNFDVRSMLAEGNDPLKQIQQKIKALRENEVLLITNNFEPVPLIKLLEKQGFESYVKFIDEDTIETYFYRTGNKNVSTEETKTEESITTSGDWEQILHQFENNLVEIDVRHLEMPMPMMTILENLETLPPGKALYVHHKRIPVFLLTELKERHFDYRIKEVQEGEVFLLIFNTLLKP
ncbi:MAG TPA: DUF2249 domain-containing protein [Chitinophagales bacterium]|nr:DUF2249 domain-containing protein [Chitinophagales bacterium]